MEKAARSMYVDILDRVALGNSLYRVTIAAGERVRQPPELDFRGLSTENYARNPVVMWAHDAVGRSPSGGLPIGRTLDLGKLPDGRIVADFEFLGDDAFAQRVKNAWDKGFLQAASISWLPLESVPVEGGGWRDTRADLLEWSIVSVPADPEALRESHRRMMQAFLREGRDVFGPVATGEVETQAPEPRTENSDLHDGHLVLSRKDYDGLNSALLLLSSAIADVNDRRRARNPKATFEQGEENEFSDGLEELRELVGSVRSAVGARRSVSATDRSGP